MFPENDQKWHKPWKRFAKTDYERNKPLVKEVVLNILIIKNISGSNRLQVFISESKRIQIFNNRIIVPGRGMFDPLN